MDQDKAINKQFEKTDVKKQRIWLAEQQEKRKKLMMENEGFL